MALAYQFNVFTGTFDLVNTGGGGSSVFTNNEVVSGSGTAWTLAGTPLSSTSVHLYANGQRLTPTVDYSIVGTAVTTVLSWATGTLLADYQTA